MDTVAIAHFVFVDFENVPNVDLALISDKPVMVTLLIGKNQKKLEVSLVQQIHRYPTKVQLIEVGASGRNALDMTLAYYLGQASFQAPNAQFHIISKDTDFDPLMVHLKNHDTQVSRHTEFAALPFLTQPKKTHAVDKLAKLIEHLKTKTNARPARRKKLCTHINNFYGNFLSETEVGEIVDALMKREIIKIDAKDKVEYPPEM